MKIIRRNSEDVDFRKLVVLLDEDLYSRNGILQAQYEPFNKIDAITTVVVAYLDDIPVGCGCFKKYDADSVEIKRMFVKEEYRENGIAKRILTELELWAVESGYKNSLLETGIKQYEALSFYSNFGYSQIDNFGQYIGNPNSICMSKTLNV